MSSKIHLSHCFEQAISIENTINFGNTLTVLNLASELGIQHYYYYVLFSISHLVVVISADINVYLESKYIKEILLESQNEEQLLIKIATNRDTGVLYVLGKFVINMFKNRLDHDTLITN